MRLYEKEQSLKEINTDSFTKKREDFLEKVKVEVYESKEGIACVDFHSLIVSLTKVYIENIKNKSIIEEKVNNVLEISTDFA